MHSNDRCTTVAVFDDEVTEDLQRRARDQNGKSILIPQNMDYEDWKKNYMDNDNPYIDMTHSILKNNPKQYDISEQQYFIDNNGNKYNVDGKSIKIKASEKERQVANVLGKIYGGNVKLVPVVLNPQGVKTPDYLVNGEKFDLKEPKGNSATTIYDLFKNKSKQADNFIIDIHKSDMTKLDSIKQAEEVFHSKHRKWINRIILMKDNEIFKILKRR